MLKYPKPAANAGFSFYVLVSNGYRTENKIICCCLRVYLLLLQVVCIQSAFNIYINKKAADFCQPLNGKLRSGLP
jgi:hypothetical protein